MGQIYKFGLNPPHFLKISFTFPSKLRFKSSGRLPAILRRLFPIREGFSQFCSSPSRFGKPSRSFATALPDLGNLPAILQRLFPIRETFLQFCSSPSRFGKPSRSFTASLPRPRKPSLSQFCSDPSGVHNQAILWKSAKFRRLFHKFPLYLSANKFHLVTP